MVNTLLALLNILDKELMIAANITARRSPSKGKSWMLKYSAVRWRCIQFDNFVSFDGSFVYFHLGLYILDIIFVDICGSFGLRIYARGRERYLYGATGMYHVLIARWSALQITDRNLWVLGCSINIIYGHKIRQCPCSLNMFFSVREWATPLRAKCDGRTYGDVRRASKQPQKHAFTSRTGPYHQSEPRAYVTTSPVPPLLITVK